MLKKECFTAK